MTTETPPPGFGHRGLARACQGRLLDHKPLAGAADVGGFRPAGGAAVTFPVGRRGRACRRHPEEQAFQTWPPRESRGFHLVTRGADPPRPYHIARTKDGPHVAFVVDTLPIFDRTDDESNRGRRVPLVAEYADLRAHALDLQ